MPRALLQQVVKAHVPRNTVVFCHSLSFCCNFRTFLPRLLLRNLLFQTILPPFSHKNGGRDREAYNKEKSGNFPWFFWISDQVTGFMTRMNTLQEIAVMTIVKFGIRFREALPEQLVDRISAIESMIMRGMNGINYCEAYRVRKCLTFDIIWSLWTWTFVQRGLYEDDEYDQRMVHIQAGKETFLSWVWGTVFGLQFARSDDEGTCFMVTDFRLEPSERQVEFHGYYYC